MRYILIFVMLFANSLVGRDNPFEAVNEELTATKVVAPKETKEAFKPLETKLPRTARVLKSVEFTYQNEDGSIGNQKIDIDKTIEYQDGLMITKANVNKTIKAKPQSQLKLVLKRKPPTMINFKNMVKFVISDKSIFVRTKDRKIRDFLVENPNKIVIDFAKKTYFYTKEYNLKVKYFDSIKIGRHKGYYRVVIKLADKYKYSKEKVKDGYIFTVI